MHKTSGLRDPAAAFPLPRHRDDTQDRRQANRAVAVSALGLAATGLIELLLAVVTGSVGLADGVDPVVITTAEAVAGSVPGVIHAHARARWTGRTLRAEIEGWVDPDLPVCDADALGRQVASSLAQQLPEASSLPSAGRR